MRQILQAVTVCAALTPGLAGACTYLEAFAVEDLRAADIILVGEVTGFEVIGTGPGAALVTLRISDAIKGEAESEMVLIWNAGLATGPHSDATSGKVLIGAMLPGRAVSDRAYDYRPDLPMIVQPHCGDAIIRPASPELLADARAMVAE